VTKAEEVFTRVEQLVSEGVAKADAFKRLAEEYGQPVNSVRGSYYQFSRRTGDQAEDATPRRTRRRETTPEDALADARAALERALGAIDREVEAAKQRADESKAEYDALKGSATERKQTIQQRLDALR
jgi:hypothetical protein